VTWKATDVAGNFQTATQLITVIDNVQPTIAAVPPQTLVLGATCTAALPDYRGLPAVSDNCGGSVTVTQSPGSGTVVTGAGVITITLTAKDAAGNLASTTFEVTKTDNEKPVITTNGDKDVNNDPGVCGAAVTVSANATDNCGVAGTTTGVRSDGQSLAAVFPVGTTTITWNVTDINGNHAVAVVQTVKVTDNEKPVITTNGDKNVNNDPGVCGASLTVSASATDNCGVGPVNAVRNDSQPLTALFPVGITTIKWNVLDINGNAAVEVVQTVTVADNEKPVITAAANITKTADAGQCGALVTIVAATATDNCGVGATIGTRSDALALTAAYPVGTTTITWNVTDIHGNAALRKYKP
jgi:hypothetical protein